MILIGDVLDKLKELPDNHIHCVVTSPPYWGLRDYGIDGQIGLEPTLQEYLGKMVAVFREVRRVLRDDGTCFVNMGDSYATKPGSSDNITQTIRPSVNYPKSAPHRCNHNMKPKDLCGGPWRLALALQDDGWWLRSDIIWHKPNPMPEAVTDRPTKSHEYIFLLTKSSKYFWDQEAVRVPHKRLWNENNGGSISTGRMRQCSGAMGDMSSHPQGYPLPHPSGRNLRTVWTISTESFRGSHFATFPRKLVETCIKAGTSEWGCCPECGGPWVRVVEKSGGTIGKDWNKHDRGDCDIKIGATVNGKTDDGTYKRKTIGWKPSCTCQSADPLPCLVLDPFLGSGTTGLVSQKMGRRWIGIELNPEYAVMAEKRIGNNLFDLQS